MSDMQFTVTRGRRAAQSHPLFRGAHLLESSAASIYDEMACSSRTGTRFIFEAGGSKVIRRLLRGRREKPGDEAI